MMRFVGAWLHNFRSHANTELVLGDNESLFINGWNYDEPALGGNATGKSLLLDGIYWCLYDVTIRGFTKSGVLGPSDTWTSVITRWQDDDRRTIDITRYFQHPKFKNSSTVEIDGVDWTKTTTAKKGGTDALIRQLFGLDAKAFLHTVVFSKSRPSLCDERPNERRKLLSHVLGLDRIDDALKAAQAHKRELEKTIQRIQIKHAQERTTAQELVAAIGSTTTAIETAQQQQQVADDRYREQLQAVENQLQQLEQAHAYAVEQQQQRRARLAEQEPLLVRIAAGDQELQRLQALQTKYTSEHSVANDRVQNVRQQLVRVHEHEGAECPTCMQVVGPAHVRTVSMLLNQELQRLERAKTDVAKKLQVLRKKYQAMQQTVSELMAAVDQGLPEAIAAGDRQIDMLVRQIAQMQTLVPEAPAFDTAVLEQSLADQRQRLAEAEANVESLQQTLEKTTHQFEIASYWVRGFGQRGLKAYILGDVLDRLQRIANDVLQQLAGDHMRVRWVADKQVDGVLVPDRLDLLVQRANQDECDYSYCSLGEQARVWIAMEWAVGEIALGKVDVRFIDECFDGLSKQGVERAVRLVAGEATERRLICISHREQVERFFNRRVTVAMRNGISSLEGYQHELGPDRDHEDDAGAVGTQSAA